MLELAVFLCGGVVMVLELTGSRVLAPYLGTSIVVWTSLIGVVLGSLSIGYWWGGRLADRRPDPRLLSRLILLASVAALLLAGLKGVVLAYLQNKSGIHVATLASTMILFAPVSVLLGMVSPFAVRLRMDDAATSGRTAGNLYALSTLGSIAGTFSAGFWLTATLGTTNIMLAMSATLVLASVCAYRGDWPAKAGVVALIGLVTAVLGIHDAHLRAYVGVYDIDTAYQRVLVYNTVDRHTGRAERVMATGPEGVQSAIYPDEPEALAVPYTRYYRLAAHFRPGLDRILMLGGGGLSFPKYLVSSPGEFPGAAMDVVEIDPGITAIAREHFGYKDSPAITLHHDDARRFLSLPGGGGKYQAALVDVFTSHLAVPFHLTTRETLTALAATLDEDGVVLLNCISPAEGPHSRFYRALLATYRSVFPRVESFLVQSPDRPEELQNIVLAAFKNPAPPLLTSADPELAELLATRYIPPAAPAGAPDAPVLTDDFAPVDHYLLGL